MLMLKDIDIHKRYSNLVQIAKGLFINYLWKNFYYLFLKMNLLKCEGNFGEVFEAISNVTGYKVAIK